jgi:hypothetical protein
MARNQRFRLLAQRLFAEHGADAWEVGQTKNHLIVLGVFARPGNDRRRAVEGTPRASPRRRGKTVA